MPTLGVDFISSQENLATTTPQGALLFTGMASLAQCESALISERGKAGMARARAQGQRISRAPMPEQVPRRRTELSEQRGSIHKLSKPLGIGYGTAWPYGQYLKQREDG